MRGDKLQVISTGNVSLIRTRPLNSPVTSMVANGKKLERRFKPLALCRGGPLVRRFLEGREPVKLCLMLASLEKIAEFRECEFGRLLG